MKGSEKALEPGVDKKQAFSKKTFYLGKDILYYLSKDSIPYEFILHRSFRSECNSFATRKSFNRKRSKRQ